MALVQARQNRVPMIPAPAASYALTRDGTIVPLAALAASSRVCQACGDTSVRPYRPHPLRESVLVYRCHRHATAPAAEYRCHLSVWLLGSTDRV